MNQRVKDIRYDIIENLGAFSTLQNNIRGDLFISECYITLHNVSAEDANEAIDSIGDTAWFKRVGLFFEVGKITVYFTVD